MDRPNPTSHYSTFSRAAAIVWIVIAVLLLLDVLWRGEGRSSWIAGALLVASIAAVHLVWLRPRVVSTERGMRVVNPLRETFVPWSAVVWVDVTDVLRVHTPGRIVRSWPLRETKRQRVRDNMRRDAGFLDPGQDDEDPASMRPVDLAARQLRQDAERYKARPLSGPVRDAGEAGPAALGAQDEPQTMVPVEVIVVLVATAVLLAAVFLLA
ncbi:MULTISPECIES: PH domain-containing protein [Nocardiopsidaceae]|uniref:PH domain-containing protein n=2 Tax=Nocardiopsidaceae TaxID=83676 RepID=A0ABY6YPQ9_9ACTN|nr:PH domain-containing protein [Streptomonospora nanhaiensis]MEE2047501.1 PH domain-containing protein [Nocardiopsis tropica]WAE74369.1 PH domain-containing protein [Streptomonospora nanhaiensis]